MSFFERLRIKSLLSDLAFSYSPNEVVRRTLARASATTLAEIACDTGALWWSRQASAIALAGRVPPDAVPALAARVRDEDEVYEVRRAILARLAEDAAEASTASLLPWLRAQSGVPQMYGFEDAISSARGMLGDLTAACVLTSLAYEEDLDRKESGEAALAALVSRHGLDVVVRALGAEDVQALASSAPRGCDRLFGVRSLWSAGRDITFALGDEDLVVAERTCRLLVDADATVEARLVALYEAGASAATQSTRATLDDASARACLWSLVALARRKRDVRMRYEACGSPRVPLDVPEDVRHAIVRKYAPGRRGSDPRFMLEDDCSDEPPFDMKAEAAGIDARLEAVAEALALAGHTPAPPKTAGEARGAGEGTYHEVELEHGIVLVSTLGPFVGLETPVPDVERALAAAGMRVIDPGLGATVFEGLTLYSFGTIASRTVWELLFFSQD